LLYEQVLFAPHVPVLHVCAAQAPQSTAWPQLLVTVPHFPEHVVAWLAGVQHVPFARHIWLLVQQAVPLQHVAPVEQHTPLQHCVVQLLPGCPFV